MVLVKEVHSYIICCCIPDEGPAFTLSPEEVEEQAVQCNKKKKSAKIAGVSRPPHKLLWYVLLKYIITGIFLALHLWFWVFHKILSMECKVITGCGL